MDRPPVRFEMLDAHVALVTLDRPEKRNAVNAAMARAMDECVARTEADGSVRAVILCASGDAAFCAGADLAEVAAGGKAGLYTPDGGFAGLVDARRRKPWIAAVRGAVLGGGLELCLSCDLVVAAADARFGLPEVRRGFIPTEGGIHRLVRAVPLAVVLELLATGEPIDARRAHQVGLVNRVVPAEHLLAAAHALAGSIGAGAPLAVQAAIDLARRVAGMDDADARALTREALDRLRTTADFIEGPAAFAEKRAPRWTGR